MTGGIITIGFVVGSAIGSLMMLGHTYYHWHDFDRPLPGEKPGEPGLVKISRAVPTYLCYAILAVVKFLIILSRMVYVAARWFFVGPKTEDSE